MRLDTEVVLSTRRDMRVFGSLLVLGLFTSCAATSLREETRSLTPCPITLAIDDFADVPSAPSSEDVMYMKADGPKLSELLVKSLGELRTSSRIVRLADLANPRDADLVLKPRLSGPVKFTCEGMAHSWWASAGLWLVSWVGGMAVNDSTYRSDMVVRCDLTFPYSENDTSLKAASSDMDVTFLERNGFLSWSTLQAIVLPPFLTSDQTESTREALTRRTVDDVAVEIARYLKRNFELHAERDDNCSVRFDAPANGSVVEASSVTVSGHVRTTEVVKSIRVVVNDGESSAVQFKSNEPKAPDKFYTCDFSAEVRGLRKGANYLRVHINAGDGYSRTLVVTRN